MYLYCIVQIVVEADVNSRPVVYINGKIYGRSGCVVFWIQF
jgi:hypothetical protein